MSCGVGHGCGSDLVLLWLWCRPAAIAPIQTLAWEPPYAADVALKRQKKKQKTQRNCKTAEYAFACCAAGVAVGHSCLPDMIPLGFRWGK